MSITVKQLTPTELNELILSVGEDIVRECDRGIILKVVRNSTHLWGWFDGEDLTGFWGVVPMSMVSDRAYLWLHHSSRMIDGHGVLVIRKSKPVIEQALENYPIILGHTRKHLDRSIRWLKWLGAEYGEPVGEFAPFEIRAR